MPGRGHGFPGCGLRGAATLLAPGGAVGIRHRIRRGADSDARTKALNLGGSARLAGQPVRHCGAPPPGGGADRVGRLGREGSCRDPHEYGVAQSPVHLKSYSHPLRQNLNAAMNYCS